MVLWILQKKVGKEQFFVSNVTVKEFSAVEASLKWFPETVLNH
jgi:hypothetical protein